MPSSILELIFKTSKQGQGGKAAAGELRELKGVVGEVSGGLLGFNAANLTAVGAIVAVGAAVSKVVGDYQNYAESIRGIAAITGTGVEETSRMVQAFDDMGIELSKIQSVVESAARKGFVMSIENIVTLADEYNALNTQEEKNALLNEKLGRSGFELAKAFERGGKAIQDAADSQAEGLLITEKNIEAAEKLRVAQDELNDAWQAMANGVAKEVVPVLADLLTNMVDGTNAMQTAAARYGEAWKTMSREQQLSAMSQEMENQKLIKIGNQVIESGFLQAAMLQGTLTPAIQSQVSTTSMAVREMEQIWEASNAATEAGLAQGKAYYDLKTATDDLKKAQEGWMKGAGGDIKSELEAQGITGEALTTALAALDVQFGTNLLGEQRARDNIKEIVAAYKEGGENAIPDFMGALAKMKSSWMLQDEEVIRQRVHVQELQLAYETLVAKPYIVQLSVSDSVVNAPQKMPRIPGGPSDYGYEHGGSFVIPPGYNENFPIGPGGGASSGERVTITPANQINTNMGDIKIFVSGAGNPSAVADAIALRLASYGKQYQGL